MKKLFAIVLCFSLFGTCFAGPRTDRNWREKPPLGTQLNFGHPLAKGLTAFWIMNEQGGYTLNDISGRGHVASPTANTPTGTTWTVTKNGGGIKHTTAAANNGFTITALATTTTFTWDAVVCPTTMATPNYANIATSGASVGFWLRGIGGAGWKNNYFFSGTDHLSTAILNNDQWHHIAIVNNAGNFTFYTDGEPDGTGTGGASITINGILCDNAGNEQFKGMIEYERFWIGRALTATEIAALAQAPYDMMVEPRTFLIHPAAPASNQPSFMNIFYNANLFKVTIP